VLALAGLPTRCNYREERLLPAAGRAAIAKAVKKRWAKIRAQAKKSSAVGRGSDAVNSVDSLRSGLDSLKTSDARVLQAEREGSLRYLGRGTDK